MSAPFGIEFYSSVDDLTILSDAGQGHYVVAPPTPHPMFDTYIVKATPTLGVVWIKGITPPIENDNFGTITRSTVDRLCDQLAQKYGRGERSDFLMDGSIWTEPQDWMSSLNNRERFYHSVWKQPGARLPDNLSALFVGATPYEYGASTVVIEYSSSRLDEAEAELERDLANLL